MFYLAVQVAGVVLDFKRLLVVVLAGCLLVSLVLDSRFCLAVMLDLDMDWCYGVLSFP